METVKHHVNGSGNSSLRGFFSSDSVDFDPPSLSLRSNITKAKAKVIYDLASGFTPDSEEREIRDLMIQSENSYELIRMVGAIEGWGGLDDELETGQVDDVAVQIARVLDQRDYVAYQLIRRYLILLNYEASPNLGDCFVRLLLWPKEFQAAEFDLLLSRKSDLLKGITSATMRERTNMVNAARIHPDIIKLQYLSVMPHRVNELVSLMFESNYTTRICFSLVTLDYRPLYDVIADMINPVLSNLERKACRDTCDRLSKEFFAAAKAVELVGSNEAKTTIKRFMRTLKAAIDNFPATLPAPSAVGAILTALGGAGTTLSDLLTAITNLPDAFADVIDVSNILNTSDDDMARQLISEISSQGALARTAFTVKVKLLNALLSGSTGDEDENAINSIMQAAKDYDQAELYQLARAATWDTLFSSVDGDEYDQLLNILKQPT